ncbi:MAG TPA: hypothetical protein VGK89_04050 [Candidatus Eisenbacteria bacterium]|jgi:hypothetical protein
MKTYRNTALPALVALAAGLWALCGCNKKPVVPIVPGNQPPTVRITSAPLDTTTRNYYVITINWIGFDPDGRVDHFLLAVDPPTDPGSDTLWESTTQNQATRSYPCPDPDRIRPPGTSRPGTPGDSSSEFHVFVVKAVDNKGLASAPVSRAFWSYTVAPTVHITDPRASAIGRKYVTPAVLIRWEGKDEDGVFTKKPVKYKFKMLTNDTEVSQTAAISSPDLVRRYYAPRNWAGWDSTDADHPEKQFTNLTPGPPDYVFVVVAFDEAGAYSPIFSLDDNMLNLRVTFAGSNNPTIGFYNDFFFYEYQQGGYNLIQEIPLEVPAGQKITFNWYANPIPGSAMRSYRWAVDIVNLDDNTARTDEETDLSHWSAKSLLVTSARLGPYPGGAVHKLYLEAEDINGLRSLGIVRIKPVQATFDKELLVVDDTRLYLDYINFAGTPCTHSANAPRGSWPTRAELDTFLFAVGGKPWRCVPPTSGGQTVLSPPGLFNGYAWDSLGTNLGINDLTIKLSKLGQYRHIVWLVDGRGALNFRQGTYGGDIFGPQTSMRYMNNNRQANTLATYVRQGGLVWLAGGGAATASMVNFNRNANNDNSEPIPRTLTFRFSDNELTPGHFIYDQAHWRSEFKEYVLSPGRIVRYLGRFRSNPGIYAGLPAEMEKKDASTDPFAVYAPNRSTTSDFFRSDFEVEFLSQNNEILEDADPGPGETFQSALDTLYKATSVGLQPDTGRAGLQSAIMTYYHGVENAPFIVTGFNIWNYRRNECKALVDFVLQQLWAISPPAPVTGSRAFLTPPGSLRAGPPGASSPPAKPRAAPVPRAPASGSRD